MQEISSLPLGYKTCATEVNKDTLPYSSMAAEIESKKLLKFFGAKSSPVGLCIHEESITDSFKCLSKALKIQQEYKETVFFPCMTSGEILLEAIKTFSFFIPAKNVLQHVFSIAPNSFYTHLTAGEKIVADIKILNSMDKVLVSEGHPYQDLIDAPLVKASDNDFVFNLSAEKCI